MRRSELEHVVRAASAIVRQDHFVVIGSQAVLGQHPNAPAELLVSMEVDLYPKDRPEDSVVIDGAIGEGSKFHETFGYYAHGVGPETACLPDGWAARLVSVCSENTRGATAWCLEAHDLAVSKLVAGRPRDMEFVRVLVRHALVDTAVLRERLLQTPADAETVKRCRQLLSAMEGEAAAH